MKVTVCELHDSGPRFDRDWQRLAEHVQTQRSDLVLLPEAPLSPWLPGSANFNAEAWATATAAHDQGDARFRELAPAAVLGTRPMDFGNERYNVGFVWTEQDGTRTVHAKSRLTNATNCWETIWYHRAAAADFSPAKVGEISVGFLIGDELIATKETERYAREGAQILVSPRSTPVTSIDDWLCLSRRAAQSAGIHELCSTRAGEGPGWIISPTGDVIAQTNPASPCVSIDIDVSANAIRH